MQKKDDNYKFSISNNTKGKLPSLPFVGIKNSILGKNYELSLVFAGDDLTKKMNIIYRSKNKPANVLSFPLTKDEGEIFLNLKRAKIEARINGLNAKNYIGQLFIHGLLHLKGMQHGSKMEKQERKFADKFLQIRNER